MNKPSVAVIGAGMAGLAAARNLSGAGLKVCVLEESNVVGGRVRSIEVGGLPADAGAQFLAEFYPHTLELVRQSGLSDALVARAQRGSVFRDGRARQIWPVSALVRSGLLGVGSLIRLPAIVPPLLANWRSLDPGDLTKAAHVRDESATKFISDLLGNESRDYFISPVLRGLLYWDLDSTCKAVLLVMLKAATVSSDTFTMIGGLASLPTAMAADLDVRLRTSVVAVERRGGRYAVTTSHDGSRSVLEVDRIVLATPAPVARRLAGSVAPWADQFLSQITYSSTCVLTYKVAAGAELPPRTVLFASTDLPYISSVNPPATGSPTLTRGARLMKVFLSDAGYAGLGHLDDQDLSTAVEELLRTVPDCRSWLLNSEIVDVCRWPLALPRFDTGYLARMAAFLQESRRHGDVAFAGDYLGGPYIEGAVQSGVRAAKLVLAVSHDVAG